MLRCQRYYPSSGRVEDIDCTEVPACIGIEDTLLWVDAEQPEQADFDWLAATFKFHPLAVEDARKQQQRAKLDWYEGYFLFVIHTARFNERSYRLQIQEIDIFVGSNYVITLHQNHVEALENIHQHWAKTQAPKETIVNLFYLVVDGIVDSYFPVLDQMQDVIDDLDNRIFKAPERKALSQIFTLRRSLLQIRRILGPLRDAFNTLLRTEALGELREFPQLRYYLNDVYDHVLRATDFTDTYRDMLSGSLDAYQSSLANKINENMQWLTVVATIFATGTLITGFYGMNLRGLLINSSWRYGGHALLAMLVVITLLELWYFRRKGWI